MTKRKHKNNNDDDNHKSILCVEFFFVFLPAPHSRAFHSLIKPSILTEQQRVNMSTNSNSEAVKEKKPVEQGSGVVKAVLSGDTLIVVLTSRNTNGPPAEREISLSGVRGQCVCVFCRMRLSLSLSAR